MAEFAIIKTGGKQYKVKVGDIVKVEKLSADQDKKVELEDILSGKKVAAQILGEEKQEKVRTLKFKAKKGYKKVIGHRQTLSNLKIESIG